MSPSERAFPRTPAPTLRGTRIPSPLGELVVLGEDDVLVRILLPGEPPRDLPPVTWSEPASDDAGTQLDAYFAGTLHNFTLPIRLSGSSFELAVWNEMRRIPYGQTISYGELARRLGDPTAARAVGRAANANPIPIVVPCHRVVGADGSLVGFGGGLEAKRRLLDLERGQASFF